MLGLNFSPKDGDDMFLRNVGHPPNIIVHHNLYSSPSIIRMIKSRRMRWVEHVARMREKRNACRILMGKPEGKRALGRPRRSWVDNIKIDLREIRWDGMDWIDVAQNRDQWRALVNTVMSLRLP
jgi:hypothetical protein